MVVERDRRPVLAGGGRARRGRPFAAIRHSVQVVLAVGGGAPPPAPAGQRRDGERRHPGDEAAPVARRHDGLPTERLHETMDVGVPGLVAQGHALAPGELGQIGRQLVGRG
jgi:hypothetical protein